MPPTWRRWVSPSPAGPNTSAGDNAYEVDFSGGSTDQPDGQRHSLHRCQWRRLDFNGTTGGTLNATFANSNSPQQPMPSVVMACTAS